MYKQTRPVAKETLFVVLALLCMCVIIVFTSLVNAGFDMSKVFEQENLSNAIINAAITIFGTVAAVPAGTVATKQRRNPDGTFGRYIQEFNAYNSVRAKVEPKRIGFSQWHSMQHVKELHQKKVDVMLEHGILQAEAILKLSKDQVATLTKSQHFEVDGESLYVKALTTEQIRVCTDVLAGKVKLHKLPDFYFLYVDGRSTRSFYDQAYYETREANTTLLVNLISKIFIGFVITSIFTGLVILGDEDTSSKEFIMKAIIIIAARIFNAITSTLWGWLLGQELVYKQCYYINGRTQFLELFLNDTDFVPLSVEEQAREECAAGGTEDER